MDRGTKGVLLVADEERIASITISSMTENWEAFARDIFGYLQPSCDQEYHNLKLAFFTGAFTLHDAVAKFSKLHKSMVLTYMDDVNEFIIQELRKEHENQIN